MSSSAVASLIGSSLLTSGIALAIAAVTIGIVAICVDFIRSARTKRDVRLFWSYTADSYDRDLFHRDLVISKEFQQSVAGDLKDGNPTFRNLSLFYHSGGRLVFRARDTRLSRTVIIKTIFETSSRFARSSQALFNEAFILGLLSGSSAPQLHKIGVAGDGRYPYLVRDNVSGASLDKVLASQARRGRPPRISEAYAVLDEVAGAIREIHSHGVIHGDIKPANIVGQWRRDGDSLSLAAKRPLKLIDFEGAMLVDPGVQPTGLAAVRGTPFFMAPERYIVSQVGASADVYSISALASLLFTGRPERPGSSAGLRLPNVEFREVIRRGMSVDFNARYSTITDWRKALSAAYSLLTEEEKNRPVDWPEDPSTVRRELAKEAVTVARSAADMATNYFQVENRIDAGTIRAVLAKNVGRYDSTTERLINLLWLEGNPLKDAAKDVGITEGMARSKIEEFVRSVDAELRDSALEAEDDRVRKLEKA